MSKLLNFVKKQLGILNYWEKKPLEEPPQRKIYKINEPKMEYELYQRTEEGKLVRREQEKDLSIEFLYGSDLKRREDFDREKEFKKIERVVKTTIFKKKNRILPDIIFRESYDVPKDFYVVKIKGKMMFFGNIDKEFKTELMVIPGIIAAVDSVI